MKWEDPRENSLSLWILTGVKKMLRKKIPNKYYQEKEKRS